MRQAGPGARGMVVFATADNPFGHVVNVVHDHNGVVYLDGQAGTLADPPDDPTTVHFLPTHGDVHLPPGTPKAGGGLPPAWVGTQPAQGLEFTQVSAAGPAAAGPGKVVTSYELASGGGPAPFTRREPRVEVTDRGEGASPRFVVARPGIHDHVPPLRVSADRTLAVNALRGEIKEFYATDAIVAKANAALREAGSEVELIKVPGNSVRVPAPGGGHQILSMHTAEFQRPFDPPTCAGTPRKACWAATSPTRCCASPAAGRWPRQSTPSARWRRPGRPTSPLTWSPPSPTRAWRST
jgi:Papain fold toxin 1, glutamine deamidase